MALARRDLLRFAATAALLPMPRLLGQLIEEAPQGKEATDMTRDLPTSVQMQFMRPDQLEAAAKAFPVVYVPFGLIEWHGKHLPLGNDALKAHAVLVKTAQMFGGVVYPPIYYPWALWNNGKLAQRELDVAVPLLRNLFMSLKKTGFRVIIGVSGHNIKEQILMIEEALKEVTADGTVAGAGLWEVSLTQDSDSGTDHAAKWETSNMMFLYPELVDLKALGDKPLAPRMKPPDGIGGDDPRLHASAKLGQRNIELCAQSIGKKAQELLNSLPPEHRQFRLDEIIPGKWWDV